MGDMMQIVFSEAEDIKSQINQQAKNWEEQVGRVRGGFASITPGVWEGDGAEAFSGFIMTQYIPAAMELIASIFGIGGGLSQGLEIFQQADSSMLGQVNDLVGEFNFF